MAADSATFSGRRPKRRTCGWLLAAAALVASLVFVNCSTQELPSPTSAADAPRPCEPVGEGCAADRKSRRPANLGKWHVGRRVGERERELLARRADWSLRSRQLAGRAPISCVGIVARPTFWRKGRSRSVYPSGSLCISRSCLLAGRPAAGGET